MNLRLPQGFGEDAYTRHYENAIKGIPCKVKIVDDMSQYDHNVKEAFFHIWSYLSLCPENGIVLNETKFKFCQDTVEFAGLKITPSGTFQHQQIQQT